MRGLIYNVHCRSPSENGIPLGDFWAFRRFTCTISESTARDLCIFAREYIGCAKIACKYIVLPQFILEARSVYV